MHLKQVPLGGIVKGRKVVCKVWGWVNPVQYEKNLHQVWNATPPSCVCKMLRGTTALGIIGVPVVLHEELLEKKGQRWPPGSRRHTPLSEQAGWGARRDQTTSSRSEHVRCETMALRTALHLLTVCLSLSLLISIKSKSFPFIELWAIFPDF